MSYQIGDVVFSEEQYKLIQEALARANQAEDRLQNVETQTMYMVGLRFTLEQSRELPMEELETIRGGVKNFVEGIVLSKIVYSDDRVSWLSCGYEYQNKKGEQCKPHIHIHMEINKSPETIRQRMRRYFAEGGGWSLDRNSTIYRLGFGKDYYAVTSGTGEKKNRFARYPWKQSHLSSISGRIVLEGRLEPDEMVLEMSVEQAIACACEEYDTTVTRNKNKMTKKTLQDRLFEYLDVRIESDIEINRYYVEAIEFYRENKYAINQNNIRGHIQAYRITRGYISANQLAESWM